MKHKIGMILLVFVLAITFMVNVNAQTTIKEDATKYEGDVYIIGSSKFDSNVIVTGTMAGVAGAREAMLQYTIYWNPEFDPETIKVYYYCGEDGTWNILPRTTEDEFVTLDEEEAKEITENLNIYYVNEEEKKIELPYDIAIKDGYELDYYVETMGKKPEVKYEEGKLIIPATVRQLEVYLVNKEDKNDFILLDTIIQSDSVFETTTTAVSTIEELEQAIADKKTDIRLENDITDITKTITIPYQVYFNGAGHKLAFKDIAKTEGSEVASGLVIAGDGSTVIDLTIEMDAKEGWQGNYALQVYDAMGVTIANYTGTKADAALLVNGANVGIHEEINVSGNEFGGIEVSKGDDPELMTGMLNIYTNITMTDEAIGKPIIWTENTKGHIANGYEDITFAENWEIPNALGKDQTYYYSSEDVYRNFGVTTADELVFAMQLPCIETITLLKDIDLPTAVEVNRLVKLELNNHNITITEDTAGDGVFHVLTGGDLTINGEGIINGVGKNDWNMVIFADGGYVTINGGTYTNVGATGESPDHFDVIYAKNGGRVEIHGGRFEGQTPAWVLNLHDGTRDTTVMAVYGGTFVGFNPANNAAEGPNTSFVSYGYKVVETDGEYTVLPLDDNDIAIAGYTAYTDLQTAVDEAPEYCPIEIVKDIELGKAIEVTRSVSVFMNTHNITMTEEDTAGDGAFHVLTGGNLTIDGTGTVSGVGNNDWNIVIFADGGHVNINGGTYTNVGATGESPDHFDVIYAKNGGSVMINGGRFEGQTPAWLLNLHDGSRETSYITCFGGTFVGFNPANNAAEGEGTNFVADGYTVEEKNGEYTVVWTEQNQ